MSGELKKITVKETREIWDFLNKIDGIEWFDDYLVKKVHFEPHFKNVIESPDFADSIIDGYDIMVVLCVNNSKKTECLLKARIEAEELF